MNKSIIKIKKFIYTSYENSFQLTQNEKVCKRSKNQKILQFIFVVLLVSVLLDFFNYLEFLEICLHYKNHTVMVAENYCIYLIKKIKNIEFGTALVENIFYSSITNSSSTVLIKALSNFEFFLEWLFNFKNFELIDFVRDDVGGTSIKAFRYFFIIFTFLIFFGFILLKLNYILNITFLFLLFIFIAAYAYWNNLLADSLINVFKENVFFQINESFKNRNLYVDSNYFLTSGSLKGLEKFSDISVPWLVDYEDSGWGGDFDVQKQIDQVLERDRKYIIDEISVEYSPNLENSEIRSGTLKTRLLKLNQRVSVYLEILEKWIFWFSDFSLNFTKIYERDHQSVSNFVIDDVFNNIFKSSKNKHLFNFKNLNEEYFVSGLENLNNLRFNLDKISISDDFYLQKKNNITNENFSKAGNLPDRKQIVYRNVVNRLNSVDKEFGVESRRPDLTLNSNYIFERQLQEYRSQTFDIKEFLKNNLFLKFNSFFLNNLNFKNNKRNLTFDNVRADAFDLNTNLTDMFSEDGDIDGIILKFTQNDLNLEYSLKYWTDRLNFHNRIFSRESEYPYLKNNYKDVIGFIQHSSILENTYWELLDNRKLGMGAFTYQELETSPWIKNNKIIETFSDYVSHDNKMYVKPLDLENLDFDLYTNVNFWKDSYNNVGTDKLHKKKILVWTHKNEYLSDFEFEDNRKIKNMPEEYTKIVLNESIISSEEFQGDKMQINDYLSNLSDILIKLQKFKKIKNIEKVIRILATEHHNLVKVKKEDSMFEMYLYKLYKLFNFYNFYENINTSPHFTRNIQIKTLTDYCKVDNYWSSEKNNPQAYLFYFNMVLPESGLKTMLIKLHQQIIFDILRSSKIIVFNMFGHDLRLWSGTVISNLRKFIKTYVSWSFFYTVYWPTYNFWLYGDVKTLRRIKQKKLQYFVFEKINYFFYMLNFSYTVFGVWVDRLLINLLRITNFDYWLNCDRSILMGYVKKFVVIWDLVVISVDFENLIEMVELKVCEYLGLFFKDLIYLNGVYALIGDILRLWILHLVNFLLAYYYSEEGLTLKLYTISSEFCYQLMEYVKLTNPYLVEYIYNTNIAVSEYFVKINYTGVNLYENTTSDTYYFAMHIVKKSYALQLFALKGVFYLNNKFDLLRSQLSNYYITISNFYEPGLKYFEKWKYRTVNPLVFFNSSVVDKLCLCVITVSQKFYKNKIMNELSLLIDKKKIINVSCVFYYLINIDIFVLFSYLFNYLVKLLTVLENFKIFTNQNCATNIFYIFYCTKSSEFTTKFIQVVLDTKTAPLYVIVDQTTQLSKHAYSYLQSGYYLYINKNYSKMLVFSIILDCFEISLYFISYFVFLIIKYIKILINSVLDRGVVYTFNKYLKSNITNSYVFLNLNKIVTNYGDSTEIKKISNKTKKFGILLINNLTLYKKNKYIYITYTRLGNNFMNRIKIPRYSKLINFWEISDSDYLYSIILNYGKNNLKLSNLELFSKIISKKYGLGIKSNPSFHEQKDLTKVCDRFIYLQNCKNTKNTKICYHINKKNKFNFEWRLYHNRQVFKKPVVYLNTQIWSNKLGEKHIGRCIESIYIKNFIYFKIKQKIKFLNSNYCLKFNNFIKEPQQRYNKARGYQKNILDFFIKKYNFGNFENLKILKEYVEYRYVEDMFINLKKHLMYKERIGLLWDNTSTYYWWFYKNLYNLGMFCGMSEFKNNKKIQYSILFLNTKIKYSLRKPINNVIGLFSKLGLHKLSPSGIYTDDIFLSDLYSQSSTSLFDRHDMEIDYHNLENFFYNTRFDNLNLQKNNKSIENRVINIFYDVNEDNKISDDYFDFQSNLNVNMLEGLERLKYAVYLKSFEKHLKTRENFILSNNNKNILYGLGIDKKIINITSGQVFNNFFENKIKFNLINILKVSLLNFYNNFKLHIYMYKFKVSLWYFDIFEIIKPVKKKNKVIDEVYTKAVKLFYRPELNQINYTNYGSSFFKSKVFRKLQQITNYNKSSFMGYKIIAHLNEFSNIYLFSLLERQSFNINFINSIGLNFMEIILNKFSLDLVKINIKLSKIVQIWTIRTECFLEYYVYNLGQNTELGEYLNYIISKLNILTSPIIPNMVASVIEHNTVGTKTTSTSEDLVRLESTVVGFMRNFFFYKFWFEFYSGVGRIEEKLILIKYEPIFEFSDFFKVMRSYVKSNIKTLEVNFDIMFLFFILVKKYIENYFLSIISIIDQLIYDIFNNDKLSNLENFNILFSVLDEIFEISFENLVFSFHNFLEFRGQLFWLNFCIAFDYIFENLSEFDALSDVNPFSDFLDVGILIFTNFLRGKDISNINFIEIMHNETNWESIATLPVLEDFELHINELEMGFTGNDGTHGITDIDYSDTLGFLGWGFENDLGSDPGNEFSTINDLFEIPSDMTEFLLNDVHDFYHTMFGLDSPKIGELAPSFDITLPVNSMWLIGVVYYNPKLGGSLCFNFNSFIDFLKIIYLDRRVSIFSKIYELIDYRSLQYNENNYIILKLKIMYLFIDIIQIFESVKVNPLDFVDYVFFYIIYLLNYFGIWVPMFMYFIFIYFGKVNVYFEKNLRKSNNNIIMYMISQTYMYTIFRFIYPYVSNSFIFIKMTFSILIILSILYIFTEGLHIFGILRVYDTNQELLPSINGLFFNLERDPFVERHTPIDEVWDEFKYESSVDDEWSRIHYNRENSEIMGGPSKEKSSVIDTVGFSKNFNFIHFFEDNDSEYLTVSEESRDIPDQIHNRVPDEYSYIPKFIYDTELEREFFRESENYGHDIEGSLDWENRSDIDSKDFANSTNLLSYYFLEPDVTSQAHEFPFEFVEGGLDNTYYDNLYNAVLINITDPKWLWNESTMLPMREESPLLLKNSTKQLIDILKINDTGTINKELGSDKRLESLINRNSGKLDQSPILDFWDSDPITNHKINPYIINGSSIGTRSISTDSPGYAEMDIITQLNKYSIDQNVNDSIYWNFVSKDSDLPINYYKFENLLLENFFESIYHNKINENSRENPAMSVDEWWDAYDPNLSQKHINFDNFTPKNGRYWLLENNFKIKKFVNDGIPEGYFNLTGYSLIDLESQNDSVVSIKNSQNLSLENLRRRDLKYKKLEGSDPVDIYYDEMLADDVDKLVYFNFEQVHGHEDNYSKQYKNDEYLLKFDIAEPNEWWTPIMYPEFRWKVLGDLTNYESPYLNFEIPNTENTIEKYAVENNMDSSVMQDWAGINISELNIKKKKFNVRKKKNLLSSLLIKDKSFFSRTVNIKKQKPDDLGSKHLSLKKTKKNYVNVNSLSSWINSGPLRNVKKKKENETVKLIANQYSFKNKIKHNFENKIIVLKNNKKSLKFREDLNYFNNWVVNKNKISGFINKGRLYSKKINNYFKDNLNYSRFVKKINKIKKDSNVEFLPKKNIENIYFFYKNNKLSFLKNYKKKYSFSKNYLNYSKNTSKLIKLKPSGESNLDGVLNTNNLTNDIYHAKMQQFLLNSKFNSYSDNDLSKKYKMDDLLNLIYTNTSWYLDDKNKLTYPTIKKVDRAELIDSYSQLKSNNKLTNTLKNKILKSTTKSKKSRKFYDVFGLRGVGEEWPLSMRMSSIMMPKYSENPIFINDEEANSEYMEMWNENFSRRRNNLSTMEGDFLRNYNDFMEYVLNPWGYGRSMLEPMYDEEYDDFDLFDDVDFEMEEKNGDLFAYEFDEDFGEDILLDNEDKYAGDDSLDPEEDLEFGDEWRRGIHDINTYRGYIRSDEDLLNEISRFGYWDGFKLRGGDQFLLFLNDNYIEKLHNKLNSNEMVGKVNWYKPSWVQKQYGEKLKPWGLDYSKKYRWRGSQYWNLQKNVDELSELLNSGSFRLFSKDKIPLSRVQKSKLNLKNIEVKNFNNLSNNVTFKINNSAIKHNPKSTDTYLKYAGLPDKYGKSNSESIEKKLKYGGSILPKHNNKAGISYRQRKFNEISDIKNNKNYYKIMFSPEHYQSTSDNNWDSELKHDFRTKYFQYGKTVKSLEQHAILQDFYDKNIAIYNRAVTPKQASDYFWYNYAELKKNKLKKFYNNYSLYSRESPTLSKVSYTNWENVMEQPSEQNNVNLTNGGEEFEDRTVNFLPTLTESWISKFILKKMNQNKYVFKASSFEIFDGIEFGFEGVADKDNVKKKNLKVRNKYSEKLFGKIKKINNQPIFEFKKSGWAKLLKTLERGNSLLKNKPLWYNKIKYKKNKSLVTARYEYLLDNIFGGYSKKKKFKNKMFDETNAAFRFLAIEELLRKNSKPVLFDNQLNKFKYNFISNLNLSKAMKDIYEVPFSFDFNKIEDSNIIENEDYDDDLENTNTNDSDFILDNDIRYTNSSLVNYYPKYFDKLNIKLGNYIKKYDSQVSNISPDENEIEEPALDYLDFENYTQNLENLNSNTLFNSFVELSENTKFSEYDEYSGMYDSLNFDNINNNFSLQNFNTLNSLDWLDGSESEFEYLNKDSNNITSVGLFDIENTQETLSFDNNVKVGYVETIFNTEDEENDAEESLIFNYNQPSMLDEKFDSEHYYNKKINTNYQNGVAYRSFGTTKPLKLDRKLTVIGSNYKKNQNSQSGWSDNPLDNNFKLYENDDTFYNLKYYKNTKLLPKKKYNYLIGGFKSNNNLVLKSMGKHSNSVNFITSGIKFESNPFEVYNKHLENNNNDVLAMGELDWKNTKKNTELITNKKNISKYVNSSTNSYGGLGIYKKFKNNSDIHLGEDIRVSTVGSGMLKNKIWKIKNNKILNTGESLFNLDSENFKNRVLIKNLKYPGISKMFNPVFLSESLSNYKKIDPVFGSYRYKEFWNRDSSKKISNKRFIDFKDKNIFYYGLSRPTIDYGSKHFIKENVKHFIKFKDNRGFVEKNINDYFDYSQNNTPNDDYINTVAIPVNKKIKKLNEKHDSDYFINNVSNNLKIDYENYDSLTDSELSGTVSEIINNENIAEILQNSSFSNGPLKTKQLKNGYRVYSATESIYPLPVIKSLSVDSKLFNKINSLRIYGAGKLQDYLYRPKLKQLLKNQNNFYNFDYISWKDYIDNEEEDVFLNKFEENDDEYEKDPNFTPEAISDNYFDKSYKLFDSVSDNLKEWYGALKQDNIVNQNHISVDSVYENNTEFLKIQKFDNKYNRVYDLDHESDLNFIDSLEEMEYVYDSDGYFDVADINENMSNRSLQDKMLGIGLENNYFNSNGKPLDSFENTDDYLDDQVNTVNLPVDEVDEQNDSEDYKFNEFLDYKNIESSQFFDKEDWLFTLYEDLNVIDGNYGQQSWVDGDLNTTNYNNVSEIYLNLELKKQDNLEKMLNNVNGNSLSKTTKNFLFTDPKDSYFDKKQYSTENEKFVWFEPSENMYDKLVYDADTLDDDDDDVFDELWDDLEEQGDYLLNRFEYLEIPSQNYEDMSWKDTHKNWGGVLFNYNSLNKRTDNVSLFNSTYLYQNKNKLKNDTFYKISENNKLKSKKSANYNRSGSEYSKNWNLGREFWTDILDDSEVIGNSNVVDDFENIENDEMFVLEKLKINDHLQIKNLKNSMGSYFIKKQHTYLADPLFDNFNSFDNLLNKNVDDVSKYSDIRFFKLNKSDKFWNLNKKIKNNLWEVGQKLINQRNFLEKKTNPELFDSMLIQGQSTKFSKYALNLLKNNNNSKNNSGIFVRKSNSLLNGQIGRRKFKKLKKKYWHRLDVLEKYLENIKKGITVQKNNNTEMVVLGSNLVTNDKPIHKYSNIEKFTKNKQKFSNLHIVDFDTDIDLDTTVSIKPNTNKKIFVHKQANIVKSLTKHNLPIDFKLNINEPSEIIKNKNPIKNLSTVLDNDVGDVKNTINFLNNDSDFLENSNYLLFKFNNTGLSKFKNTILSKNYLLDDNELDDVEDTDEPYSIFSKIRNNLPKLQTSKFGNSYLPLSVVSTFLNKIPNISITEYIDESPKILNFYQNEKIRQGVTGSVNKLFNIQLAERSFNRLNVPNYFKKLPVIDPFSVYHKKLSRPGQELKNHYHKTRIEPFQSFTTINEIENKSLNFGLGSNVYKNNFVTRRSFELASRTFGPDIRTNSTMRGYGRFDHITDFNVNSEEDSGLMGNLGYPVVNEQNLYVYDLPDIVPTWGGSDISDKFLGFIWDGEDEDFDDSEGILETLGNFSSNVDIPDILTPVFNYIENSYDIVDEMWEFSDKNGDFLEGLSDILEFSIPEEEPIDYNLDPNYTRPVQIWSNTIPLKYSTWSEDDAPTDVKQEFENLGSDQDFWISIVGSDFDTYGLDDTAMTSTINYDLPYDVVSKLDLTSSTNRRWSEFQSKSVGGVIFEDEVTSPFSQDIEEKNIGPLGFEEGDSLYDNRILNRGWFPEKLVWNWGLRGQSKVGSDSSTLELLSDYSSSFSHELDNFGFDAELEGLKSLGWAGNGNKVFNAVDDVIEGLGIEENIPFRPKTAKMLWDMEEYLSRHTYDNFRDRDMFRYTEDDEDEFYWNWKEPYEYHQFKDNLFNTLGLNNYIAETYSWKNTKYFGNVDSAQIPGISLALAENELYDGIVSDFSNFVLEKFPNEPLSQIKQNQLPLTTEGMFKTDDFADSKIPEFSKYVTITDLDSYRHKNYWDEINKKDEDFHFNTNETFKPKDSFNFSPDNGTFLKFDPEWVINGEGWVGNSSSNIPIIGQNNVPLSYINPIDSILSQPKGIHSFKINSENDSFGGVDSPYFSLSDYQSNRIFRGRDNDVSNFPINSGWFGNSNFIPKFGNVSYKYITGGANIFSYLEEDVAGNMFSSYKNYSNSHDATNIQAIVASNENYEMTDSLEDNPDFLIFNSTQFNQRDLWWKAVSGGYLNSQSKTSLSDGLFFDKTDQYRDFLLSYDYRLFGKSWMNPQDVKIPVKSFSFYGDSQINDWIGSQKINPNFDKNPSFSAENATYLYTYGLFKNSKSNFDQKLNYYSIKLRNFLYNIYNIGLIYMSFAQFSLYDKINILIYNIFNYFQLKLEFYNYVFKIIINKKINFFINYNFISQLLFLYKYFYNLIYVVIELLVKVQYLYFNNNEFSYKVFELFFDLFILFKINFNFKLIINILFLIINYLLVLFLLLFFIVIIF